MLPFASCNLSQALFQSSLTERCSDLNAPPAEILKHRRLGYIYGKRNGEDYESKI